MAGRIAVTASQKAYEGAWAVLARLFRVPREGPTLPVREGERLDVVHPAPGFLWYLKFWFWLVLVLIDVAILAAWVVITVASPLAGALLAVPALVIAVVPDIFAYVAIHLRYDTTWYVLTERSMRLRRGIWTISEVTITFENVQNVRVRSGPVQRHFGIADVIVETAGGGKRDEHGGGVSNQGVIEGVANAVEIRDLVMSRVRASRTTGLGDEKGPERAGWSASHVAALREIRDEVRGLAT